MNECFTSMQWREGERESRGSSKRERAGEPEAAPDFSQLHGSASGRSPPHYLVHKQWRGDGPVDCHQSSCGNAIPVRGVLHFLCGSEQRVQEPLLQARGHCARCFAPPPLPSPSLPLNFLHGPLLRPALDFKPRAGRAASSDEGLMLLSGKP